MTSAQPGRQLSDEAVTKALAEVNSTAEKWRNAQDKERTLGDDTEADAAQARAQLIREVWSLYSAIKGPVDMIHDHLEKFTHTGAVRALLTMGVFDELPVNGDSRTAQQLSDALKVEKQLLVRLMRIATAIGPFAEVGQEEYAHTDLSRVYLDPGFRGFFSMAIDEHMAVMASSHEYYRQNGFRMPTSPTDNPYTFHFNTGGVPIFQWMAKFPDRLANFNMSMTVNTEQGAQSIKLFPWAQALGPSSEHQPTTPETLLVVDVGGGRGHAAQVIRAELDRAGVRGRVVLEDQAAAVREVEGRLAGGGIEAVAHDFFAPQPSVDSPTCCTGALVYFLRRVLHDWSDEASVAILRNVAAAMGPASRVVINEFLIPETGTDPEASWVDLIMMTCNGGMERTAAQFERILDAAGLRLTNIYKSKKTHYVAVEARLKGS